MDSPTPAPEKATLPSGKLVQVLNGYESAFVIREIFEENAYPMDEVAEIAEPVIIDVGANIGIFVCYAMSLCPEARVLAFEPAPQVYDLLKENIASFGPRVTAERCGISDAAGEAEFTYYPSYSLLSGFKAATEDDERLLRSGIATQLSANPRLAGRVSDRHVAALAEGKLDGAVTVRCPLQTLSHFINRHGLARVDFLKVDAERCEVPILRGISGEHWPLIQRVCMELHENDAGDATTADVCAILTEQGFQISVQPSGEEYPRTLLLRATRAA